ncbi:hypothetical protein SSP531S_27240 [Streptomyces spongiicola]|uniref:Uncharacterized protein n=1 Tax=Streptomyces spongiicola TaxID=1690221 RepID=A0A388SZL4_9ACTN|nr:hypothetical protein SSP531S_27240 [Streptomyces spongiicola]
MARCETARSAPTGGPGRAPSQRAPSFSPVAYAGGGPRTTEHGAADGGPDEGVGTERRSAEMFTRVVIPAPAGESPAPDVASLNAPCAPSPQHLSPPP